MKARRRALTSCGSFPSLVGRQTTFVLHSFHIHIYYLYYTNVHICLFLCCVLQSCYVHSVPPPLPLLRWKCIFIYSGYLDHYSVTSDFLIDFVFWLPLACSLPFRKILDVLKPCYLSQPPTMPEEPPGAWGAPLCPTFLLTWSQWDSPSRSWRCWQSFPGHAHTHLASYPQEGQTHRGTCIPGTGQERKESLTGEGIWLVINEPISLNKARSFLVFC